MACLFLVPCSPFEDALCITDNDGAQAFSTSLIQLWDDFQVTNPGYAPLIRLYNGDPFSSPFMVNGLPYPVTGCHHVVYSGDCSEWEAETTVNPSILHYIGCDGIQKAVSLTAPDITTICALNGTTPYFTPSPGTTVNNTGNVCDACIGCGSITQFPGMGDLPIRTAYNAVIGGTMGYTPPVFTAYNVDPGAPVTQSIPCEVCTSAIWAERCSTGEYVEIYNSSYGSPGNANADANWATFVDGLSRPVIYLGENDFLTSGCYNISIPDPTGFPPGSTFTFVDVQDWTSEVIPVTGYFPSCIDCGGTATGSVFKLTDCSYTHSYYVIDNTSASGSLSNYVGQTVTLTLPTSLTGLSIPITTCVTVSRAATSVSYTSEDLGVITSTLGCSVCTSCYTITDCENSNIFYSISTVDPNLSTFLDTCESQCNGCEPIIYINYPESAEPRCWKLSRCTAVDTVNIDFYDPLVYTLTCSNQGCLACNSTCYEVTFCPCSGGDVVILANPTFTPFPVLDTVVEGVLTVGSIEEPDLYLEGCMTITELPSCNAMGNTFPIFTASTIVFDTPPVEPANCDECCPNPPGYKITRCDDPGIYFIVSNNLNTVVGKVITGVSIINCNSTSSPCASVKKQQCWVVSLWETPGPFDIQYESVLNDCSCCPNPCD